VLLVYDAAKRAVAFASVANVVVVARQLEVRNFVSTVPYFTPQLPAPYKYSTVHSYGRIRDTLTMSVTMTGRVQ
jgi:hypothetical protein